MQNDIIKNLNSGLSSEFITSLANLIGENESGIKTTICAFIPMVINKAINHLNSDNTPYFLNIINNLPYHNSLSDLSKEIEAQSGFNRVIEKLNSLLFPESLERLVSKLSSFSGISIDSVRKVLFIGSALLFNAMKGYLSNRNQQSSSLKTWLHEQKKYSDAITPKGFTGLLTNEERAMLYPDGGVSDIKKKHAYDKKWPWLLLLVLLSFLLLFMLRSCVVQPTTQGNTNSWGDLGALISKKLPNGSTLQFPDLGMENKLIQFIEGQDNKSIWFSFDRLKFKTNRAELQPESDEQLKNIADILNAYPNIKMQLGGYTDNTGDNDYNLKLSQDRADSVRQELITLGADGNNIEAKGYGSAFPVAPNDTEENRAKNRRIDIRMIK